MINDDNQITKAKMRRETFKKLFIDPKDNLDITSVDYFLDIVDEISLTKDLANGEVNLNSFGPYDVRLLNRMYKVGSILNKEEKTPEQLEVVHDYIDSCCIDFGKSYYEIGLVRFKNKITDVINSLYEDIDFYDAVIGTSNSLDSIIEHDRKKNKTIKKTIQ